MIHSTFIQWDFPYITPISSATVVFVIDCDDELFFS